MVSRYNLTRIKGLLIRAGIEFETIKDKIQAYNSCQENCTVFLTKSGEINLNGKLVTDQEFEEWVYNWR